MKIRICFEKTGEGRYLSHLDLARAMERSLRRARTPLAFSEGFHPHPKLSFASALAVGMTGRREYLDVELAGRVELGRYSRVLAESFPPALAFVAAEEIGEESRSLSAVVNLAVYRLWVAIMPEDAEKAAAGIAGVLAAKELWRKPKLKPGKKPVPAKEVRGLIRRIGILGAIGAQGEAGAENEAGAESGTGAENGTGGESGTGAENGAGAESGAAGDGRRMLTLEMELHLRPDGQLRPQELWEMIADAGGFTPAPPEAVCREALLILQGDRVFGPMEGVSA